MATQLAQALTSLVLHVTAARQLGPGGLGVFALIFSGIVLATAISTGLVGDSLTVLARERPRVRAGLQVVGAACALALGAVAAVLGQASGLVDGWSAAVLGLLVALFTLEDLARRLLMASLRFWSVVTTDVAALGVTVAWLGAVTLRGSAITLTDLLVALIVGQLAGIVVAWRLAPSDERWFAPLRAPDIAAVLRFGSWRAAQQGVRPATLTTVRSVGIVVAGAVAFGELEGARVYVAPALLAVNGISSFLFASYASQRHQLRRTLLRRADVSALGLALGATAFGGLALVLLPLAGHVVTGGGFELDGVAVVGWSLYAASTAFLTPYGGLAAVGGAQARVFTVRIVEALGAIALVVIALVAMDLPVRWVPWALAPSGVIAGLCIRQLLIVRGGALDAPLGPGTPAPDADRPPL